MNIISLAKKIWGLIYPMLIYLGIQVLVVIVSETIYAVYLYMHGVSSEKEIAMQVSEMLQGTVLMLTMISALITIPILAVFMKRDNDKKKANHTFKWYEPAKKWWYLLIIPFGVFNMEWANMFVSILQLFMPKFMTDSYTGTQTAIYGSSMLLQLVAAGIVAPIVEEMIFRGLIYKRVKEFSNVKAAAILSALLFGVFHGNWVQAPYAIILGLAFVFVYEKYKSIIAPILLHMSANISSVVISYFAMHSQQTQQVETVMYSNSEILIMLFRVMMFFFGLAAVMGIVINSIVKLKEVNDETINSSDTVL